MLDTFITKYIGNQKYSIIIDLRISKWIFWSKFIFMAEKLGLVAIKYIWFLLVFLLKTLLVKRHLHKRGRWEHFPTFFSLDPFLTFCSKSSKNAYKFKWEAFRPKSWSHFSCNFFGGILAKKMGVLIPKMSDNTINKSTFATISWLVCNETGKIPE